MFLLVGSSLRWAPPIKVTPTGFDFDGNSFRSNFRCQDIVSKHYHFGGNSHVGSSDSGRVYRYFNIQHSKKPFFWDCVVFEDLLQLPWIIGTQADTFGPIMQITHHKYMMFVTPYAKLLTRGRGKR